VPSSPSPHPLALDFARAIALRSTARALLLGFGSGRNVPPVMAAATRIVILEEDAGRARAAAARFAGDGRVDIVHARYENAAAALPGAFEGALTTHALLHGNRRTVSAAVAAVRERLEPHAPFFITLGSTSDPRYGAGDRIDDATYAARSGSEAGVPHTYFDRAAVAELLEGFLIDALDERDAAETAGSWAHTPDEAATLRHWFVRARRR
jgi:hypothetical protein